jgi:hypothetical protein
MERGARRFRIGLTANFDGLAAIFERAAERSPAFTSK